MPDNFVEFPDSHSYIRTPTHKQPITDYEAVREKAASQKRDVERALTRCVQFRSPFATLVVLNLAFVSRFIAKTGKTHSLFKTDDTNLFPLISCDRTMPDQPVLPAYINALLFKDQIFEEDEREYLPKKKKKPAEDKDGGSDKEDDEKDEEGDKVKENKEDSDMIDNPYLRPVRLPRTSFKNVLPPSKKLKSSP